MNIVISLLPVCLSVYLSVHPCRIERFWKTFWIWKDFGVLVGCFAQKLPIINLCDTERSHFTCSLVNHQISVWGNQAKLRTSFIFSFYQTLMNIFELLNAISILKPKFRRVETDACFSLLTFLSSGKRSSDSRQAESHELMSGNPSDF